MSRAKLDISEDQVIKLMERGYSVQMIADFFKCDPKTIRAHFPDLLQRYPPGRLASMKVLDLMWTHAIKTGNTFALKYLAQEFLGYVETQTIDVKAFSTMVKELSHEDLVKFTEAKLQALKEVNEEAKEE